MGTTLRIIHVHRYHNDEASVDYIVCVNDGTKRVHMRFSWTEYDGDPCDSGWKCSTTGVEFSPCNCGEYNRKASDWMRNCVKRYHSKHAGNHMRLRHDTINSRWLDPREPGWKWVRFVKKP